MDSQQPPFEQKPLIFPTTSKKHVISLITIGIVMFFIGFGGGYLMFSNKNETKYPNVKQIVKTTNSPTATPIQTAIPKPLFEDLFVYTLPQGYKKDDDNSSTDVTFFRSPDSKVEGYNLLLEGATITIISRLNSQHLSLKEYVDEVMNRLENKRYNYPTIKIAGLNTLNAFICYEGCKDTYFLEKDGYIWEISMMCMEKCNTKSEMSNTQYGNQRDFFINSIKLK